ncbi:MAG: endonuclease III [Candidatus Peribacteria bacterium]|nr:endonuclease III [Candidatus Peribacteria bacterium]
MFYYYKKYFILSSPMRRTPKTYDQLFTYISTLFPKLDTELHYETPFQLLVAVMLSAQSTDKQVNKITDQLFLHVKTPYDILQIGQENLEKAVNSINYYKMKAKHIFQTAKMLVETQIVDSTVVIPSTTAELTKLPGVGEKTAKVIQYVLYKQPVIAVDTHVHRVANRLGIVHTAHPLQTSKEIEHKIPKKRKLDAHHALILFGRYYCKAIKPKCADCGLQKLCEFYTQSA